MPDSQPFCFPVCAACRETPCPRAFTPKPPKPPYHWAPRELPPVKMECGCTGIPWPCIKALGEKTIEILCPTHGWVKPVQERKLTKRQIAKQLAEAYPELPPF